VPKEGIRRVYAYYDTQRYMAVSALSGLGNRCSIP
jgi:hypothetical protein